jgi:hypothetical protein
VAWRPAQAPAAATNQLAQGYAALRAGAGAYELSGIVLNFRDIPAADAPMPPFVAGRQPHYYVPGIAGFSLAAALKPDSARARIGAALYRSMLSPAPSSWRSSNVRRNRRPAPGAPRARRPATTILDRAGRPLDRVSCRDLRSGRLTMATEAAAPRPGSVG